MTQEEQDLLIAYLVDAGDLDSDGDVGSLAVRNLCNDGLVGTESFSVHTGLKDILAE